MAMTDDARLCAQVNEALDRDTRTSSALVELECLNGMVTLTGNVKEAATKAAIEEIASTLSGVQGINSEVRVVRHAAQPE